MPPQSDESLTDVLLAIRSQDPASAEARRKLFERVYPELRRLAGQVMRSERTGHTLSPTDVVHDAFLRLVDAERIEPRDRSHFLAIAARVMRHVLVDYARRRNAAKRGGRGRSVTLNLCIDPAAQSEHGVMEIHDALGCLARVDPRAAEVAEARLFGGLTIDEIAVSLGVSRRTVDGNWLLARRWLTRELAGDS